MTPYFEVANFGLSNITDSSFTAATTSFTLANPSNFSAPTTNQRVPLVMWNFTDYPGSSFDDPLREIVYCTDITGSIGTFVRAQEGSSAITSKTGKTYRVACVWTKAMYEAMLIPAAGANPDVLKHSVAAGTPTIQVENTQADSDALFQVKNDAVTFSAGVDGSDSDKFKIAAATTLGTTADRLTIGYTGAIGFNVATPSTQVHAKFSVDPSILRIETTAADGDAAYQVTNDAKTWTFGVDGSDSDSFKISDAATVEAAPILKGTTGNQLIISAVASAPADADLYYVNTQFGSVAFYLDQSAHNLMVKVKYNDGTVKSGTVCALT